MAETRLRPADVKAVIFDVDGTLYRQGPLRRAMLLRLAASHAAHPVRGWRTLRILRAYRQAQEHLRAHTSGDVAAAQIAATCERTNVGHDVVVACVERWMEQEPLALLPGCLPSGLIEFLNACRARGLRLAAFSDYPAAAKLRAMGIADRFELVLCAQDADIGAFKPSPRGLLVTMARLGSSSRDSLYVGDRVDVDAAAAAAAGMPCAILTRNTELAGAHMSVTDYHQLHKLLFGDAKGASASRGLNQVA